MHRTSAVAVRITDRLAHARGEEVPRIGNLDFAPHKQPRPRKHPLLLALARQISSFTKILRLIILDARSTRPG